MTGMWTVLCAHISLKRDCGTWITSWNQQDQSQARLGVHSSFECLCTASTLQSSIGRMQSVLCGEVEPVHTHSQGSTWTAAMDIFRLRFPISVLVVSLSAPAALSPPTAGPMPFLEVFPDRCVSLLYAGVSAAWQIFSPNLFLPAYRRHEFPAYWPAAPFLPLLFGLEWEIVDITLCPRVLMS